MSLPRLFGAVDTWVPSRYRVTFESTLETDGTRWKNADAWFDDNDGVENVHDGGKVLVSWSSF
jgi:hypothetical protein